MQTLDSHKDNDTGQRRISAYSTHGLIQSNMQSTYSYMIKPHVMLH